MSPALVKFVLFAEVHKQLSRLLEGKLEVYEVSNEVTHRVKDDVLSKHFRYAHRLALLDWGLSGLGALGLGLVISVVTEELAFELAAKRSRDVQSV